MFDIILREKINLIPWVSTEIWVMFCLFFALQWSHWITIFAALGEDYNPKKQYTLNDFSLYHMYDHSAIIFEICHDAMQQANLSNWVNAYTISNL